jgi:CheY-like chemotaxis protein
MPGSPGIYHILVVDDESYLIKLVTRMLKRSGYKITSATHSIRALEIFQSDPDSFDLVITDKTMPEINGIDLSIKILALRPDMPIILCTGYPDDDLETKIQQIGIKKLFIKPFRSHDLMESIHAIMKK